MRVTLIHNPGSGDAGRKVAHELVTMIRNAGHDVLYQSSKDDSWERALDNPGDLVAVAGGDGTVGKVAKLLFRRNVPLAILPQGTANNISSSLGLTGTPIEQLIAGWPSAQRRAFDAASVAGPCGSHRIIESLGIGLFAETMHELDSEDGAELAALDTEERIRFVLRRLRERLQTCQPKDLTVTLDGQDLSGQYILLEAMNIRFIGPNLFLAPQAASGDGLLDIVLLRRGELDRLDEYLAACLHGHPNTLDMPVQRGQHLRILWQGFRIHIDDVSWPERDSSSPVPPGSLDVRVETGALEFLVGESTTL